jgi:peroxiredoxin
MNRLSLPFVFILFSVQLSLAQMAIPEKPEDISPLLVGEKIPDVTLKNSSNESVNLLQKISEKKTVLVFFRGGWCPYCNKQLGDLQSVEAEILQSGYQIIAISPDSPQSLMANTEKNNLTYTLYSDSDLNVSKLFGLVFKAPQAYETTLAKASENMNSQLLPVPSIFILDQQGIIKFEYINPNFKERMSGKMLSSVVKSLNAE